MIVSTKHFPEIPLDNDITYISNLIGVVESVDEYSTMEITRGVDSYHFRIAPSIPSYNQLILEEILKFNNFYHIRLNLSKSIKSSGSVVFDIQLENYGNL